MEETKMKIHINGVDAEGTPEELAKFSQSMGVGSSSKSQPEKAFVETKAPIIMGRHKSKDWNTIFSQVKNAMESKGYSFSHAMKEINGNTCGIYRNNFKDWLSQTGQIIHTKRKSKKLSARGQELMNTAWQLKQEHPELTRSDAVKQAAYMIKRKPNTPVTFDESATKLAENGFKKAKGEHVPTSTFVPPEFPNFATVDIKYLSILENVLKHIIANKGSMSFFTEGFMIGIEDGNIWREFCLELERKQDLIKKYFNVSGRLVIKMVGRGYHTVLYEGGDLK